MHGFAPLDDAHLITGNLFVRNPTFYSVYWFFTHFDPELYIPLTWLSYMVEQMVWKLDPFWMHVDQLVLHAINSCLVFVLMRRIGGQRTAAAIGALLFAVHPIQTEVAVWLSARKDVLSAFFALLCTIHLVQSPQKNLPMSRLLIAAAFLALGLLAKVSVIGLPIALAALLSALRVPGREILRRTSLPLCLSAVFGSIALVGKFSVLDSGFTSPLLRILYAAIGHAIVLLHILFPRGLTPFYTPPMLNFAWVAISICVAATLLAATLFLWKRHRLLAAGMVWWATLLAPALLNVQTDIRAAAGTFAADRYAYVAMVGWILLLTACMRLLPVRIMRIGYGFVTLVCCGLIFLSRAQTAVWSSADSLLRHAVAVSPASVHARTALADILRQQGRLEEAFALLKDGLQFGSDPRLHLAAGQTYAKAGQTAEAAEQFRIMESLEPHSPEAAYALGQMAEHDADSAAALALYRVAAERETGFAAAHRGIARILLLQGDTASAKQHLEEALHWHPFDTQTLSDLAALLEAEGMEEEAAKLQNTVQFLLPPK